MTNHNIKEQIQKIERSNRLDKNETRNFCGGYYPQ
mgnify:CR=1 FL=1